MMKRCLMIIVIACLCDSVFAQLPAFNPADQPAAPDYSKQENWVALPFRMDVADEIPKNEKWVNDSLKEVDVFYIYPTMYTKGETWNADISNKKLNGRIERLPVRFQATPFNQACRVYAPRYRQAILDVFYNKNADGDKALDFAYEDVKKAFEYYLKNYNNGRPIIIAAHSQGTLHARKLVKEFFDGKPLQKQLVAAYLVGYAVPKNTYVNIPMCNDSLGTGCYISWMSTRWGWKPQGDFFKNNVSTNPLSWNSDTVIVGRKNGVGGIFLNPKKKFKQANTVRVYGTHLWVKTRIPFFVFLKNQHVLDYNLFWYDIRKNVANRVKVYQVQTK